MDCRELRCNSHKDAVADVKIRIIRTKNIKILSNSLTNAPEKYRLHFVWIKSMR